MPSAHDDSLAVLVVEYESHSDPARKYDEIQREMNALRPTLPADVLLAQLASLKN